jgi:phosphatidate cytidylyltransferase
MLKLRIITALILIPIVVALAVYSSPEAFFIFTALVALAGAWEWSRLMEVKSGAGRILYLLLMSLLFFNSIYLPLHTILIIGGVWWVTALLLVGIYPRLSGVWGRGVIWRGLMGIMVLLPCWRAINYIRNQQDGLYALLFLFILIWGADTTAYFVGKKWGRQPLAVQVSPGKTVQGVVGALVFTVVITAVVMWLCQTPRVILPWGMALSLLTVIFSIVGDLFESALKRRAGLKDSGKLLPGHGGLLDRIDSLTAAAPVFALGALLLGMYLR